MYFNVPRQTIRSVFVGREKNLEDLHKIIIDDGNITGKAKVVWVDGMAGVGKSTLVRQYIESYTKRTKTNVVWLSMDTKRHLHEQLKRLTTLVSVTCDPPKVETAELDVTAQMDFVYSNLLRQRTLIVFDNVEVMDSPSRTERTSWISETDYMELLPSTHLSGSFVPTIIVTSRTRGYNWPGCSLCNLTVSTFTPEESKTFLKCALETVIPEQEFELYCREVAETVCGNLPAALEHAVSTILTEIDRSSFSTTDYTIKDFLENSKDPSYFFQKHPECYSATNKHLVQLWEPCVTFLQQNDDFKIAFRVLEHLCVLQARISRPLLGTMALEEAACIEREIIHKHTFEFEQKLEVLRERSLVELDPETASVDINVVTQRVLLFNEYERIRLFESVAKFLRVQLITAAGYEKALGLEDGTETSGCREQELWRLTSIGKLPSNALDETIETANHVLELGRRYNVESICKILGFVQHENFIRAINESNPRREIPQLVQQELEADFMSQVIEDKLPDFSMEHNANLKFTRRYVQIVKHLFSSYIISKRWMW